MKAKDLEAQYPKMWEIVEKEVRSELVKENLPKSTVNRIAHNVAFTAVYEHWKAR